MKVVSSVISMDVDIDEIRARGDVIVMSGFSGVNEIEVRLGPGELLHLAGLGIRPTIIGVCIRFLLGRRRSQTNVGTT